MKMTQEETRVSVTNSSSLSPSSMTFLSSGYSQSLSVLSGRSVHLSHQFSSSLIRHGFYQDNTLTAATKSKERHLMHLKKNRQSMDRLVTKFGQEAKKIAKLQQKLARNQQEMVYTAQQKFAIPYLQAIFRGYLARKLRRYLRSVRLIQDYYKFKLHFRIIVSKVIIIQRYGMLYLISKKMIRYASCYRSAIRIQRWFRRYYVQRLAIVRVTAFKLWNHVKLFGITRSRKRLLPFERYRYILYRFMRSYIRKQRLKRLSHPLEASRIFYSLFQSDVESERLKALPFRNAIPSKNSSLPPPSLPDMSRISEAIRRITTREFKRSTLDTLNYLMTQFKRRTKDDPSPPPPMTETIEINEIPVSQMNERDQNISCLDSGSVPNPAQFLSRLQDLESRSSSTSPSLSPSGSPRINPSMKLLHLASNSQLDNAALFYLDISVNSLKHTPYILRDTFRLLSFIDIIEFLRALSTISFENPSLLFSDLTFPVIDYSVPSQSELNEMNKNMKRKRIYKPVAETILPFGGQFKYFEPPKRVRFQRRGGMTLPVTQPKRQKSFAIVSKEEQIKKQQIALELASIEARITQRKLDHLSVSSREGRSEEKENQDNENVIDSTFDSSLFCGGNDLDTPLLLPFPLQSQTEMIGTQLEPQSGQNIEISSPVPSVHSEPLSSSSPVPVLLPVPVMMTSPPVEIFHLNLSLSPETIIPSSLSPSPSSILPRITPKTPRTPTRPTRPVSSHTRQEHQDHDQDDGYEDDFESFEIETQSRTSSRSSRRCLTPASASNHPLSRPMSRRSSKSSDPTVLEIRSPSRPDGPMPSNRRSFRELSS